MKASLDCQCSIRRPLSLEGSGSNPSLLASLVSAQHLGHFRHIGTMLLPVPPTTNARGPRALGPGTRHGSEVSVQRDGYCVCGPGGYRCLVTDG